LSAYAQYASGFLAPPLAFFQEIVPNNNVSPQTTTNYQIGSVYKTNRFNADIDAYWIDYKNFPVSFPIQTYFQTVRRLAPTIWLPSMQRGKYYGVEAEGTTTWEVG